MLLLNSFNIVVHCECIVAMRDILYVAFILILTKQVRVGILLKTILKYIDNTRN